MLRFRFSFVFYDSQHECFLIWGGGKRKAQQTHTNLAPIWICRPTGMRCATLEVQVMESNPPNRQQYRA